MMCRVVLALAFGSATAFMASTPPTTLKSVARESLLEGMEGATPPCGIWDPLNLAELGTETTVAWYRAAELKHGRVAMAATVGWSISNLGITFPGEISAGVPFTSLGKGIDAWVAVPNAGKAQIIAFIGILEVTTEAQKPHYLMGGRLGYVPGPGFIGKLWDPAGITDQKTEEELLDLRTKELNNGRLAMIAVISFFAAHYIPGSVPGLPGGF